MSVLVISELAFRLGFSTVVVGTFKRRHFHRDVSGLPWTEDMFLCARVIGSVAPTPTPDNDN